MTRFRNIGLSVFLVGVLLLGSSLVLCDSIAGTTSSSGGFSKPASSPGDVVFGDRSGGGFFGGSPKSDGFSKPSSRAAQKRPQTTQSGGFRKPGNQPSASATQSGGFSKPTHPPKSTVRESGGFAKPGPRQSSTEAPPAQKRPQTTQSGGFRKPGDQPSASASQSGGFSKPTHPPKSTVRESGGFAKPGPRQSSTQAPQRSAGVPATPLAGSKFDQKMAQDLRQQKANESLKAYKAEHERFKNPANTGTIARDAYTNNPIYSRTKNYGEFDYNTHYSRRDDYYRRSGWDPPPYVYNSQSRFGMWDALALWSILDHTSDRDYVALAHNQASDPGYQQWRKEAEKQAETNTELKEKLAKLDAELEKVKDQPRDPDYLPKGVPAEVAISADALKEKAPEKPKLRIATGSEGGNYHFYGNLLKMHATALDVVVNPTAGSMENLRKLIAGEADMAIVQSDVLALLGNEFPGSKLISEQTVLYNEAVQMVANTDSGIKRVKDLKPGKHTVYIGPEGSGTAKTWEGFVLQDPGYKKIKTENASYEEALAKVAQDPNCVMMFVSGLNNAYLRAADEIAKKSGKLRLVAVDDWNFNDKRDEHGNRIYEFVDIGRNVYPNLQKARLWGTSSVETVSVQAVAVVRTEWVKQYGSQAMDALAFAIMESSPEITQKVNGLE